MSMSSHQVIIGVFSCQSVSPGHSCSCQIRLELLDECHPSHQLMFIICWSFICCIEIEYNSTTGSQFYTVAVANCDGCGAVYTNILPTTNKYDDLSLIFFTKKMCNDNDINTMCLCISRVGLIKAIILLTNLGVMTVNAIWLLNPHLSCSLWFISLVFTLIRCWSNNRYTSTHLHSHSGVSQFECTHISWVNVRMGLSAEI